MSRIKVSVLLPVYNGEATIVRAINSILEQSFDNFELLIINNGSNDTTGDILTDLHDPRIQIHHLEKPNLVNALNFGIQISQGQYIARMDADDLSYKDRLQLQIDYLDAHEDIDVVSGLVKYQGDQSTNRGYYNHVEWLNKLRTPTQIYLNRFVDAPMAHPSVMFRKSTIEKHGPYEDGNFPEDYQLWLRWFAQGVKMAKVPEYVLEWYDSQDRLSRNDAAYDTDHFSQLKAKFFSEWVTREYSSAEIPPIYVWGTGSAVKKKSRYLESQGITIHKYIDVQPTNSSKTIYYKDITRDMGFILSYVSDRLGKSLIYDFLLKEGYQEGLDFYMME